MLKRISDLIGVFSKGWVTLFSVLIFFLFTALVLPGQSQRAQEASAGGDTPDLSLLYSPDDLYAMAETYGQAGRQEYIQIRFSFDLIWPLVYTLFLATSISWVFTKAFGTHTLWQIANLAPVAGLLLDLLENISTSLVIARFPQTTPFIDILAPAFTFTKWLALALSFLLLLGGLFVLAYKRFTKRDS